MKSESGNTLHHELTAMIDHTLLKPDATAAQIAKLCQEARDYCFKSVCINPYWVPYASKLLRDSSVKVCTVIGFPLGATTTAAKVRDAAEAVAAGASEVDMVQNIGALKSGDYQTVLEDIRAVVRAVQGKAIVKVILETCLLNDSEKIKSCQLTVEAGADFVKTSTGFGAGGATIADISLMRQTVGPDFGVKASGGVRDYEAAMAMIQAGASRIGTSSGVSIVQH